LAIQDLFLSFNHPLYNFSELMPGGTDLLGQRCCLILIYGLQ